MNANDRERDYTVYKQLVDLWSRENPIKTSKLQVLMAVNGFLLSAVSVNGGFKAHNWPIYLGGAIFSLVWVLSIGRTSLFQKIWQVKIRELQDRYPDDERFAVLNYSEAIKQTPAFLRVAGMVSSKYYLVGAPFLFFLIWLGVLVYFFAQRLGASPVSF